MELCAKALEATKLQKTTAFKKKMETFKQSLNDHVSETIRWKIELGDNKDLF